MFFPRSPDPSPCFVFHQCETPVVPSIFELGNLPQEREGEWRVERIAEAGDDTVLKKN